MKQNAANLLEIENVTKRLGAFKLENVSFKVPEGFIMGFVGPNGAGKTSTIKLILGMLTMEQGSIRVLGNNAVPLKGEVKEKIGVVMDNPYYVKDWTVQEVAGVIRPFYRNWDDGRYKRLIDEFSLSPKKKVKELSRGMGMKLMIAVALSHDARLLILDEPTSGLDPVARDEFIDILTEYMTEEGRGVLFSTHITSDLEKIADYITFIKEGRIVYTGTKEDLLENYLLVKGGKGEMPQELKAKVYGYREYGTGFEALAPASLKSRLPGRLVTDPANLDEIIVHMNKGGVSL